MNQPTGAWLGAETLEFPMFHFRTLAEPIGAELAALVRSIGMA